MVNVVIILLLLIVGMLGWAIFKAGLLPNLHAQRPDKSQSPTSDFLGRDSLPEILRNLLLRLQVNPDTIIYRKASEDNCGPPAGAPVAADDEEVDGTMLFDFQGGKFMAQFQQTNDSVFPGSVSISYFNCLEMPAEQLPEAQAAANTVNNITVPIKCTYTPGDDGKLNFSLHTSGLRLGDNKESDDSLYEVLTCFFRMHRTLMEQSERINADPMALMSNRIFTEKVSNSLKSFAMQQQPAPYNIPTYAPLKVTLGDLLHTLFRLDVSDGTTLHVDGEHVSDDPEVIRSFPVLSLLVSGEGADTKLDREEASLTVHILKPVPAQVMMSLSAAVHSPRLIMATLSAMLSSRPSAPFKQAGAVDDDPRAVSLHLGIPTVSDAELRAEAEYKAGEEPVPDVDFDKISAAMLYWGKTLYADGRYYEAVRYLRSSFDQMESIVQTYEDPHQSLVDQFCDVCFMLGMSMMAMGDYFTAYYYLDYIWQQGRVTWTCAFVECLMAMHDPRLSSILQQLRSRINTNTDDDNEAGNIMLRFIEQKEILLDIEFNRTDQARARLEKILERDPDDEFALMNLRKLDSAK
jgi:hypothetical protein